MYMIKNIKNKEANLLNETFSYKSRYFIQLAAT